MAVCRGFAGAEIGKISGCEMTRGKQSLVRTAVPPKSNTLVPPFESARPVGNGSDLEEVVTCDQGVGGHRKDARGREEEAQSAARFKPIVGSDAETKVGWEVTRSAFPCSCGPDAQHGRS